MPHPSCESFNNGALHTSTETGFTVSGSPIRIQCHLVWAPHWAGFRALSHGQHSMQLGSGSRPWRGKVVFGCGSMIYIGSGSKIPCWEPQWISQYLYSQLNPNVQGKGGWALGIRKVGRGRRRQLRWRSKDLGRISNLPVFLKSSTRPKLSKMAKMA